MFDFMKDLYLEACGLDMEQVHKERKEKIEKEKAETVLVSKNTKKNIMYIGIVFILIHLMSLVIAFATNDFTSMIKSVIMIFISLITLICFLIKSKSTELFGILLSVIIVILSFVIPHI